MFGLIGVLNTKFVYKSITTMVVMPVTIACLTKSSINYDDVTHRDLPSVYRSVSLAKAPEGMQAPIKDLFTMFALFAVSYI